MTTRLIVLGTRYLAIEMADLISDMPDCAISAFVENLEPDRCREPLEGKPVVWIDDLPRYTADHLGICALSTTHRKPYIQQAADLGLRFATLIHPTARLSRRATLGEGAFLSAMTAVSTYASLGRHVFVNRGALIGHHTVIGDYCTIQPGANIAGAITIGEGTYVGMGAVILDRLKIGAGCIIAAGAVVTKDLPDHVQVMGVPARIVKTDVEGK